MVPQERNFPQIDPLIDGIDGRRVAEPLLAERGRYAEENLRLLIELKEIDDAVHRNQVDGLADEVTRLRIKEARTLDRLKANKSDAIADLCFAIRASINTHDHTLPNALAELLDFKPTEIKDSIRLIANAMGGRR